MRDRDGGLMVSTPMQPDSTVLERISDGVLILDRDWRVVFINTGGARLLERSVDSLRGEIFWEHFPGAVGAIFDEQYRRAMRRQEPGEFDAYSATLGCWFSVRTFPSPDELTIIFQDATQRHDADDAFRSLLEQLQRQRRLATVLAETNEVVFRARSVSELFAAATSIAVNDGGFVMAWIGVIDAQTGVLTTVAHAGEGAEEYLRTTLISSRNEPLGRGAGGRALRLGLDQFSADILSDVTMAPWRDAAKRVGYRSSGGLPLRLNGEVRGLLSVYTREPSYFNDDERNLVHRLAANVSYGWEALQREEDLRESDVARRTGQRFRAILAAAPDAMLALTRDGHIEMANDRVYDLFGRRAEEITGAPITTLITRDTTHPTMSEWLTGPKSGESSFVSDGFTAVRRDGTHFRAEVACSSVADEAGESMLIISVHDLTERLELEERRRQFALEAQREQQNRLDSLGRLAGGVAHDFNNLLGVILNLVTLIEKQEMAPPTRHDVAQVRAAAERGAALTRQLLTFARREPMRTEPVDVGHAVRGVATLLERTLGPSIALDIELAAQPLVVLIDHQQLDQVMVNLVLNARDAMAQGGRLVISTAHELDAELPIHLRVSDTGTGMSPEVISQAFEPFFTTKARGQGTGLGLATVYGVISRAGGRITIDSRPGVGTSFDIHLPAASDVAPPASTPTEVSAARAARILLVDDDLALRDATQRILHDAGYDVYVASDGRDALNLLTDASFDVDVVVSDVVMPRLSGVELAHHLQRLAPDLPVILMTGFDSSPTPLAQPVLPKPVDGATLMATLKEALRGR